MTGRFIFGICKRCRKYMLLKNDICSQCAQSEEKQEPFKKNESGESVITADELKKMFGLK